MDAPLSSLHSSASSASVSHSGAFTLRHDTPSDCGAVQPRERELCRPKSLCCGSISGRSMQRGAAQAATARTDALLVLQEGVLVIDVSVVQPAAGTYVQDAASTDGAAAALRSARKVEKYKCGQTGGGYDFEPVIVETKGCLGEPAFELLARLASIAAERGKVDKGKFIENTLMTCYRDPAYAKPHPPGSTLKEMSVALRPQHFSAGSEGAGTRDGA